MKFKLLPLAIATSILFVHGAYAATNTEVLSKEMNASAVSAYWTPERLKNAKPIEFEVNETDVIKITPNDLPPKKLNSPGEDGKEPTLNITPNTEPLFTPLSNGLDIEPKNSGTRNEQFSSSRLIPLSADQTYPYRAVGKLYFTKPTGNFVCSASVIKPRIVLTAGHCVHEGSGGANGFYTNFLFIPAFRDGATPFGSWAPTYVSTTTTWATGNRVFPNAADYAMLEMKDQNIGGGLNKIGSITGYLGYQLQALIPNHVHQLGYPCNLDNCAKMHQVAAESAVAVSPNNVEYGSDMGGGASGGPWVQNFGVVANGQTGGNNPGVNRVVGVTSWGYTNSALMALGASIFDSRFTTLINTMCNHQSGNC